MAETNAPTPSSPNDLIGDPECRWSKNWIPDQKRLGNDGGWGCGKAKLRCWWDTTKKSCRVGTRAHAVCARSNEMTLEKWGDFCVLRGMGAFTRGHGAPTLQGWIPDQKRLGNDGDGGCGKAKL